MGKFHRVDQQVEGETAQQELNISHILAKKNNYLIIVSIRSSPKSKVVHVSPPFLITSGPLGRYNLNTPQQY